MQNSLPEILQNNSDRFSPVVPFPLDRKHAFRLDLSTANRELYEFDILSTSELDAYIRRKIRESQSVTAVGGYGEDRLIYRKSPHFGSGDDARTIHLGIDVWCQAKTPLFAPLDGKVHSFQVNDNLGDYGPTIILEHELEGIIFYALYGHLTMSSLEGLATGKVFKKGTTVAQVGQEDENGHWPPHLHYQLIMDMQDKMGDFPGVASARDKEYFLKLCPDPAVILGIK